jgi:hypothetical protein
MRRGSLSGEGAAPGLILQEINVLPWRRLPRAGSAGLI